MSDETKPDEADALRTLVELQANEIARLQRDLAEAHRVLTRLAACQLGMVG